MRDNQAQRGIVGRYERGRLVPTEGEWVRKDDESHQSKLSLSKVTESCFPSKWLNALVNFDFKICHFGMIRLSSSNSSTLAQHILRNRKSYLCKTKVITDLGSCQAWGPRWPTIHHW